MNLFRRLPLLVLVTFGCAALVVARADGAANRPAAGSLRVMTFNVRLSAADDGEDSWPRRTDLLFTTIRNFRPDLVGFQEVMADQHDALVARMPEYAFSGVARDDGKRKGEWSLIGFRQEVFSLVDQGDFWLSEQPAVPGSKSWDAAFTRLCSWVRLRETATGRELVFANTHFDHEGVVARRESAKLLSRELSRIAAGVPAILTGDFNTTEDDPAYATLSGAPAPAAIHWLDAYRTVHPTRSPDERTFHAFKGGTTGSRIDYIFHTSHFMAVAAAIDRSASAQGRFPSDHYPITAVLKPRTPGLDR
jgi:endonuclease/exonuclease/phosphatase family metal-dependent hydrolase